MDVWENLGHSPLLCSSDLQIRQQKGTEGVSSSSCCFPLSVILTGGIGDGEGDSVAYAETGLFSSEDEEEGSGDSEEEGGERLSLSLKLWRMSPQSCCMMYSTINTRGIT